MLFSPCFENIYLAPFCSRAVDQKKRTAARAHLSLPEWAIGSKALIVAVLGGDSEIYPDLFFASAAVGEDRTVRSLMILQ